MRFLLKNITKESKQATRLATKVSKRNTIKEGIISSSIGKNNGDNGSSSTTSTSTSTTASDTNRTWGQQCSPTCGCVLRIEAHMDNFTASSYHSSPRISSASYNAKTIVTTIQQSSNASPSSSSSSYLEPVMTQCSNPRPIMKECTCTTLHSLASAVVNELPKFTLTQAQNQLEFTGVRSSPAFRYSVLSQHQLLPQQQQQSSSSSSSSQTSFSKQDGNGNIIANDGNILKQMNSSTFVEGKCYDLVEEALIACLKGYMPKPRRTSTSIDNHHGTGIAGTSSGSTGGIDDHNRLDDQPIRQPSLSYSHHHYEGDTTMNDYEEARNSLDPLRFVRAAKNRLKHSANYYTDSTSTHDHSSSSSSSLSSSSSTHSSMPPFHFMNDSHHSQDHISTIDTLSQLQIDLRNDKTKRIEQEGLYNDNDDDNDFHGSTMIECWQSYVDELHMAQEEKEEQPNTA